MAATLTEQMVDAPSVELTTAIAINRDALRTVLTDLHEPATTDEQRQELRALARDLRFSIIIGAVRWLESNGRDFEERRRACETRPTIADLATRGHMPRVAVDAPVEEIARKCIREIEHGLTAEHRIPNERLTALAA